MKYVKDIFFAIPLVICVGIIAIAIISTPQGQIVGITSAFIIWIIISVIYFIEKYK